MWPMLKEQKDIEENKIFPSSLSLFQVNMDM